MTKSYCMLLLYALMTHVKNIFCADAFLAYIFKPWRDWL